jgi:hypothetical protein
MGGKIGVNQGDECAALADCRVQPGLTGSYAGPKVRFWEVWVEENFGVWFGVSAKRAEVKKRTKHLWHRNY